MELDEAAVDSFVNKCVAADRLLQVNINRYDSRGLDSEGPDSEGLDFVSRECEGIYDLEMVQPPIRYTAVIKCFLASRSVRSSPKPQPVV